MSETETERPTQVTILLGVDTEADDQWNAGTTAPHPRSQMPGGKTQVSQDETDLAGVSFGCALSKILLQRV